MIDTQSQLSRQLKQKLSPIWHSSSLKRTHGRRVKAMQSWLTKAFESDRNTVTHESVCIPIVENFDIYIYCICYTGGATVRLGLG